MTGARPRALPGRQPERDRFAECLDQARQGIPMLLLLEGEAGSGKTSLLDEIETSPLLPRRLIAVARVNLDDGKPGDAVHRAAALLTNPKRLAWLGGRRRARRLVHTLLPEWIGTIPVIGNVLAALIVTFNAVRRRRAVAATVELAEEIEALHSYAQRRPTALLIDDLHLLDDAAADRLFRLIRFAGFGTRLLVIGTVTTPPPGAPRPAVRMLRDRLAAEHVAHHRLDPLRRSDLVEWMHVRFDGAPLPAAFMDFLLDESGGQPGAVEALLARVLAAGALHQTPAGSWLFDAALGREQLDAMEPASDYFGNVKAHVADVVSAASVFGDEFDALALSRLLDVDELELEDRLANAMRAGLLVAAGEETYPGGDISTRYRFSSSALRAALHRNLSAARRNELEALLPAGR